MLLPLLQNLDMFTEQDTYMGIRQPSAALGQDSHQAVALSEADSNQAAALTQTDTYIPAYDEQVT